MRTLMAFAFAACVLPAQAETPPVSCAVFDSSFCFRSHRHTVVTQRSAPDAEIYSVSTSDGHPLYSVHAGSMPTRPQARTSLKHYKEDGFDIDIGVVAGDSGERVLDLVVHYPDGRRLHLDAVGRDGREALADVMPNFRPCARRGFTSIDCEERPLFNPADAELIRQIK